MIIDLAQYKAKKKLEDDLARGRTPLYISHLTGKISGNSDINKANAEYESFPNRLARIRASLDKINYLMDELKQNRGESFK